MKEEFIIKVLSRSLTFLEKDKIQKLRFILEEELYHCNMIPECTELAVIENLPDMVNLYLAAKRLDGLSEKTLKNYWLILRQFMYFMHKNVEDIDSMDIRMYLTKVTQRNVKNTTVATTTSYIRSFFKWLRCENYIRDNPMDKIKTIKTEKRLRKPLSPEEFEMVRMACKSVREKAIFEFFYSTACRLDEVHKLNRTDIDWFNKTLLVIGKGNKERRVYLNAKSILTLKNYLETRKDMDPALFVIGQKPYSRLGSRSYEKIFAELGVRAGISRNVHPHLIRHTTATNMLNAGASLTEVQIMLGHDDPSTTLIYSKMDEQAVQISHKKHIA